MVSVKPLLVFAGLFMLGACLSPVSKESPVEERPAGPGLSLKFDTQSIALLDGPVDSLIVRLYEMNGEERGKKLGDDHVFPFEDEKTFTVTGLTLGKRAIEILMIDDNDRVLARGEGRVTIVPGIQTLDEIVLEAVEPALVAINLSVDVRLKWAEEGAAEPEVPPLTEAAADVLFGTNGCTGCHSGQTAAAGLDLVNWPFSYTGKTTSLVTILDDIIASVAIDAPNRMPLFGPPLSEEQAGAFVEMRGIVADAFSNPDATPAPEVSRCVLFLNRGDLVQEMELVQKDGTWTLPEQLWLKTGSLVSVRLEFYNPDGVPLHTLEQENLAVPADGRLVFDSDVELEQPGVEFTVRVE